MYCSPSRLVLGTAQLGMTYGIANKIGQPNQSLATAIVREAWENGIREFDTAQGYGVSEQVLGKALSDLGIAKDVKVISKFDPNINHLDTILMSNAMDESIKRLSVPNLYGIMLHREEFLTLWDKGIYEILSSFVLAGKVKFIGISVYSPDKAIEALNTEGIDFIQIPTNILDRRFENAGVFDIADKKKKMVYIRSIFLQGLLLMNTQALPEKMSFAVPVIERLERLSKEFGLTRHEIALGYIKSEIPTAKVVFGAETKEQVTENLAVWQKDFPPLLGEKIRVNFSNVNEQILNPHLW